MAEDDTPFRTRSSIARCLGAVRCHDRVARANRCESFDGTTKANQYISHKLINAKMPRLDADIFSNLNGTNGLTITGLSELAVGIALSLATGDFNGDGVDDLAIGTFLNNSVFLILGPLNVTASGSVPFDTLIDGTRGFQVMGSNSQGDFG